MSIKAEELELASFTVKKLLGNSLKAMSTLSSIEKQLAEHMHASTKNETITVQSLPFEALDVLWMTEEETKLMKRIMNEDTNV